MHYFFHRAERMTNYQLVLEWLIASFSIVQHNEWLRQTLVSNTIIAISTRYKIDLLELLLSYRT